MFATPSREDGVLFLKFGLLNIVLFLLIYVPTNNFIHSAYLKLYFPWELNIPLIDWMILPYHAFNLLFLFPLFLLTKRPIHILGVSFAVCTLIAGIFFFFFPTQMGYVRVIPDGPFAPLFAHLFMIAEPTNLVPSLHVTYTTLYFISCVRVIKKRLFQVLFTLLLLLIVSSTLFIHQHHVIDVVAGIILALCVFRCVSYMLRPENSPHHQ